jgi:hypothetical protein
VINTLREREELQMKLLSRSGTRKGCSYGLYRFLVLIVAAGLAPALHDNKKSYKPITKHQVELFFITSQ